MKLDSNNLKSPIHWVCHDCGTKALKLPENKNKKHFQLGVSTYHLGACDVCFHKKYVTQTRDFGFPIFEVPDVVEEAHDKYGSTEWVTKQGGKDVDSGKA